MRGGEVERHTGRALELCVVVELGTVVGGDGFEALRMAAHEAHRAVIGVLLSTGSELADDDVAGFTVDNGDETVLITLANDGIDLPVTDLGAQLGGGRALADVTFAGKTTAAVIRAVAFAPSLAGAAQVRVQRATEHSITPDVAVDRLVADGERAAQSATDLLGAPQFTKLGIDAA